jgi:protein-tyrosine phosphatase
MAHAVFQHLVAEAGLSDQIALDSAGTGSWHVGEPPHRGTQLVLAQHGITFDHRARRINRQDFDRFDYVLAMDRDNLANLQAVMAHSAAELSLLMDFAPEGAPREVPDPYYSGRFDEVYSMVHRASVGLLAHIREQHDL